MTRSSFGRFGMIAALLLSLGGCERAGSEIPTPEAPAGRAFGVEVTGKGPAMVFIPGLSTPGEVWAGAVARYGAGHRCHVLTLNGFGGRPRDPGALEEPLLERVIADLASYLHDQQLQPVVVGHSLGGVIALGLAARAPVAGLVIVDALPYLPAGQSPDATPDGLRARAATVRQMLASMTPEAWAAFERLQPLETMVTRPEDVARLLAWGLASDPVTVGQALYDLLVTDLRPRLAQITAPTLVLPTAEPLAPGESRELVEALFRTEYAALPGVELTTAPRARHFIMLDDPDWLWQQIDALLARVAARAGVAGPI